MSTPTIEELSRELSETKKRLAELERLVGVMRRRTNESLMGHSKVVARVVDHVGARPSGGVAWSFPANIDVGCDY